MKSYLIPILALTMVACQKEKKLTATPYESPYKLPQGNTPADDAIMAIHQKYGSYVLYRFTQADYAYGYTTKKPDSAFNANPAYVANALRFFQEQLMAHYPESFLRETMPYKILLASYIGSGTNRSTSGFASTMSMLAIGWADSTIQLKTPAELKKMRGSLHYYYWERAFRTNNVTLPREFLDLAPVYVYVNVVNRYSLGVVSDIDGPSLSAAADYFAYIQLLTSHTTAELEAGLFQPSVDTKGLIRKKYNIVNDYCKRIHGLDLQAIGQFP